ncbi:MAG: transcription antitermination factor NusB [Pseudomonadota bacterium]|nr:transcription antitermination factor NusB [Pseudomonadota bacterium]
MTNRRQSREAALQVLFQYHFTPEINVSDSLALFESHFLKNQDSWKYAKVLTLGVLENIKQIDESLQTKSRNWKLGRMAGVDLNILRLALFEICYLSPPVPKSVVINEAVELAKKFGTEQSSAFVNGVLDSFS